MTSTEPKSGANMLNELFISNPLPMFILAKDDLSILEANNAAISSYEFNRTELLERSLYDIDLNFASFYQEFKIFTANSSEKVTRTHRKKNGLLIDVTFVISHITFHEKICLLMTVTDSKDIKLVYADKEVCTTISREVKKEYDFRTLADNAPSIIQRINRDLDYTYINRTFEKVLKKSVSDLIGKNVIDINKHNRDLPLFLETANKVFNEGTTETITISIPTPDQTLHFLTVLAPEYDENGIIESIIVISNDITAIKIAEKEVRKKEAELIRSNQRFKLAAKATKSAIWDYDFKTQVLYWGDGFYSQFGYTQGYIESRFDFWESHIHPAEKDKVTQSLDAFIELGSKELWREEYRFKRSDGKFVSVVDKGYIIFDENKKAMRMVGSMEDITEQKRRQKKIIKEELDKQKLVAQAVVGAQEKERAEIGKELHDNINQILSTAKLFLEVAKVNEQERMLLIKKSADHIHHAINEIRSISRSLVPPSIGDLGLSESINDLVSNIKMSGKINAIFNAEKDLDAQIPENQQLMLFRIVQEQVNNVMRHAEAKNLAVVFSKEDNHFQLQITDDGKGFSKENIKKGVGLSNIISRAEIFNGTVQIDSSPGEGCTLVVTIPLNN
ncbi:PAS domain S-box protein [Parasegetibacter sp. MAH-26]|uniref:histidine kinase n=2 Tax=Pinibacter aurantiacus TaxID=2851599 RepID=A0A9E2S8X5_9BACT|nr:PAS domain S-box protein [Pinibacter aurantiacus]